MNFAKFLRTFFYRVATVAASENGVNLAKFLRTSCLQNTSGRLPLYFIEGRKICFFTLGWNEQRRYDTAVFLLEMFVQNLVLGFFGLKKIKCKNRKKHIETFYY